MQPRRGPAWLGWLVTDVVAVLVFCALGRRSHDEGVTASGLATTAWPFLAGTALGWLLSRGWRRPTAVVPTGVIVWASTLVVGMLLRKVSSASVAVAFIAVASTVTAVFLLGWRAAVELAARRRSDG
ncbi:DUF3054 domain-containing protein [Mycobacterium asiaticum]|uniref:DUF3054 domain-containing protein n=1 Tax=Mycobacterium asiaticum TaxID=1790 RepID=A0A1A3KAT1_MYCAS|nr:DUF3054 domain-containing protein [Mycobacterium asiaticum]OBI93991.1 hypothetical protein A5661_23470 [Mycobacterium asiaticum]OBJ82227.1 hypothetical protein A5640_21210 [Mycobacterium asiaticum]